MKWIVKCFKKYTVFNGRAGREEYTYFTLFVVFIQFFFLSVDFLIGWEFENIKEVVPVLPLFEISNQIKTFVEGIDLISVYIIDFFCAHIISVLFLVYLHYSD